VLKVKASTSKALLLLLAICHHQAMSLVIHTSLQPMVIYTHGTARHGTMTDQLSDQLAQLVQLDRQEVKVHKAMQALLDQPDLLVQHQLKLVQLALLVRLESKVRKVTLDLLDHKVFRAFKAFKAYRA
jgi:hypothetical protein